MATDNKSLVKAWDLDRLKVRGGVVYVVQMDGTPFVKIGTAASFDERMKHLQTASPFDLILLLLLPGGASREESLHRRFADDRVRGEWFRRSPAIDEWIVDSQEEAWRFVVRLTREHDERVVAQGEAMERWFRGAADGR